MSKLSPEMEVLYAQALDELFALGRNLPRGSFRLVAEKYDIKEYTLRMKYWRRTEMKPSPFLKSNGITIGEVKFESNPFQISEAIILLIKRLNTAEDKNRALQAEVDRLTNEYNIIEKKYNNILQAKN